MFLRVEKAREMFTGFYSALLLRLICWTWRKHTIGLDKLDQRLADGQRLIAVFWHGKYYSLLPLLRNRNALVFTSLSSRGAVISSILRNFGFTSVQLRDHGREKSLQIMRDSLIRGQPAAIAVDGPLGPYHVVHRGAVQLASELDYRIIPMSVASTRKHTLSQRWDRFEMPRMFSKVVLLVGEPITIPPSQDNPALDIWITKVQQAIESVDARAECYLTNRTPP